MSTFICPVCNGKGVIYDHASGLFTLGISYIFQAIDRELREPCYRCEGKGFVIV